jgi:CubicO group peptidase (beta-lactamase class C family)
MRSIESQDAVERFAASLPHDLGVPGVAVGYRASDGSTWTAAAGLADVEGERALEVSTPLRIASITKTLTATAVGQLSMAGKVGLDDPMVDHIPELARIQAHGHPVESLLVRHFLTHRAGIVGEPPTRRWLDSPFPSIEEILEHADLIDVVCAPGAVYKYSNLGYALLGELIARTAGVPYETFIRDSLIGPAGMRRSAFDAPDGRALGYGRANPDGWPRGIEQEMGGERPGGGLWSTAEDLLIWAGVALGGRGEVLPKAVAELLLAPEPAVGPELAVGQTLAWDVARISDRLIHSHEGALEGFISALAFDREAGSAAVVLTNGHSEAIFKSCLELLGVDAPAHSPKAPPRVGEEAGKEPIGSYLGPVEWRSWILSAENGGLSGFGGPFDDGITDTAPLQPAGDDRFIVTSGRHLGEALRFERDDSGAVVGFTVSGFQHRRLMP